VPTAESGRASFASYHFDSFESVLGLKGEMKCFVEAEGVSRNFGGGTRNKKIQGSLDHFMLGAESGQEPSFVTASAWIRFEVLPRPTRPASCYKYQG
jgi:hypothetical protein